LFLELLPGGAPVKKSTAQYKALLAAVRPRGVVGKTRRRMAAEELGVLESFDVKLKAKKVELKEAVEALGSHLMDIHGIGPAGAARILADVADVARSRDRNHFASWTGTAPIDASSALMPPAANTPPTACPGGQPAAEPRGCTWPASSSCATTATTLRDGPTTGASAARARHPWKPCGA
jgi:hypothetical protein